MSSNFKLNKNLKYRHTINDNSSNDESNGDEGLNDNRFSKLSNKCQTCHHCNEKNDYLINNSYSSGYSRRNSLSSYSYGASYSPVKNNNNLLMSTRRTSVCGVSSSLPPYQHNECPQYINTVCLGSNTNKNSYQYPMNKSPKGQFLIINNQKFLQESGMAEYPRHGSQMDSTCLQNLFENLLDFKVSVYENVSRHEMIRLVKNLGNSRYPCDCIGVAILSHGSEGIVYGIDGPIHLKVLVNFLKTEYLVGIPKIFIIQACQGNEYMDLLTSFNDAIDGYEQDKTSNILQLPSESDFLYAFSTVHGYYSWRNTSEGSWFIQSLCKVFTEMSHNTDVLRMLTRVTNMVSYKRSMTDDRRTSNKCQIPTIVSNLRKDLYLKPK